MLLALFIAFAGLAIYPLAVYPVLVILLARLRPRPWIESAFAEPVAHLITVHNEAARIEAKLDNALSLERPAGGLRTIVVDDGSSDDTRAIVERYRERGVSLMTCDRLGKEAAQIEAIRNIPESVIVFSDASTALDPEALTHLVRPFADPQVAAVSGTDRLDGSGSSGTGEDIYVRYEMRVRRAESLAGSLVGLSGCLFAARRSLVEELLADVPSDLGTALLAIGRRKRAVGQDSATCTYAATPQAGREFARKRRTALRGLRCLSAYAPLRRPIRPVEAWQVLSHKWLRFMVPWFALAAATVALVAGIAGQTWGIVVATASLLGLVGGFLVLRLPFLRRVAPLRAVGFLLLSNMALLAAWIAWFRGTTGVHWTPTERPVVRR